MIPAGLDVMLKSAKVGVILAGADKRIMARGRPAPSWLKSALVTHQSEIRPLLLPTNPKDWPPEWRELLDERIEIDRKVYDLTHEAASFVSEAWFRLAHARLVANSPPPGEPWADLALDDVVAVVLEDHQPVVA